MTAVIVTLAIVTALVALIVIAWAVRALFFRDLGQRARPRGEGEEGRHRAGRLHSKWDARAKDDDGPTWLPATPAPVIHHDEYRVPQWYHDEPPAAAPAPAAGPTPVTLVIFAAAIIRHEFRAEVLSVFPDNPPFADCLSDDTLWRGMRAIEGGA